ncbi:MAG: YeiH family protein [Haloarculaceae archaeon]
MRSGPATLLPGLLVLVAIAGTAGAVGSVVPLASPLVVAIGIGAIVANTAGVPGWAERGVSKGSLLLETAIVLLGAGVSLDAMIRAGPLLVALVVAVVAFGVLVVTLLSRAAGLNDRLGSLLAAGSSVCGVSAIAAAAPACDAEDAQIAHAAATILLFDAVTLVAFPAVGRALDLDPRLFGVWIGLSMFSTGPVAAAGFAHSAVAGEWATMTKLARNALIGVVAVWYSIRYTGRAAGATAPAARRVWIDFPKFLLGFLALAVLANAGALPQSAIDSIAGASDVLFLLAFAGLGLEIRVAEMRDTGLRPLAIVGAYLLIASAATFGAVRLLF